MTLKHTPLSLALVLASAISHATASYDPTARICDSICFTSFRFCSDGSPSDAGMTGCAFPANTYPESASSHWPNIAMIVDMEDYTITWTAADAKYPVLIEWSFSNTSDLWGTNAVQWAVNTTEPSFVFSPDKIIKESFPGSLAPNTSRDEARRRATTRNNYFRISQPERPVEQSASSESEWAETSQWFSLQTYQVLEFMNTTAQLAEEARGASVEAQWKKGVAIGVGVGVPVLLALTALIVWAVAKRRFVGRAGGEKAANSQKYEAIKTPAA